MGVTIADPSKINSIAYGQMIESSGKVKDYTKVRQLTPSDFKYGEADQFKYELHALPEAGKESIGTSLLLAAWNAAVYVAQIDDIRAEQEIQSGQFVTAVEEVLAKHGKLWFTNESFVIERKKEDEGGDHAKPAFPASTKTATKSCK